MYAEANSFPGTMTQRQRRSKAKVKRARHKRERIIADQCECDTRGRRTCTHASECKRIERAERELARLNPPPVLANAVRKQIRNLSRVSKTEIPSGLVDHYHVSDGNFTEALAAAFRAGCAATASNYARMTGDNIGAGTLAHMALEGRSAECSIYDMLQGYADVLKRKAKRQ